MEAERPK